MTGNLTVGWFDNHIKFYREKFGYTQKVLAVQIGICRQSLNAIENGKLYPNYKTIVKLLYVFDCKFDDLFDYEVHYV